MRIVVARSGLIQDKEDLPKGLVWAEIEDGIGWETDTDDLEALWLMLVDRGRWELLVGGVDSHGFGSRTFYLETMVEQSEE